MVGGLRWSKETASSRRKRYSEMSFREISEFRLNLREKAAEDCVKKIQEFEEQLKQVEEARIKRIRDLEILERNINEAVKNRIISPPHVDRFLAEWSANPELAQSTLAVTPDPALQKVLRAIAAHAFKTREQSSDAEWYAYTSRLITRLKHAEKIWRFDAKRARSDLQEIDDLQEKVKKGRATALSKLSEILIEEQTGAPRKRKARGAEVQTHAEGVQQHTADEEAVLSAITF